MAIEAKAPLSEATLRQTLWQMISGCFVSQAISVAATLGIADLLSTGPQSPTELARQTGTHAPSLYRLLRALASVGIFVEDDEGRFDLTPLAALLRQNVSGSLHAPAAMIRSKLQWPTLGDLLYSVQTGECAFNHLFEMGLWEYTQQDGQENKIFHDAMSSFSAAEVAAVCKAYDFSAFSTLMDIAGGHGRLLAAILQEYPRLQGILFDLPHVAQQAEALLDETGVAQRSQAIGGDMFSSIPAGCDAYIMKTVIHDWDDEQALALLCNCYAAMPSHGRLLLITRVIAPANVPDAGKFMDLNMLITLGGRERTAAEFTTLLDAANLVLARIIPTQSALNILECVKR